MNRIPLVIPLLLLVGVVNAEDKPAPTPPPPPLADPTAPVPPPPPVADPNAPAPPVPIEATTSPRRTGAGTGAPARGNRAAGHAGQAGNDEPPRFVLRAEFDAGWDSNVLREAGTSTAATDTAGVTLGGELRGTWRALRTSEGQLSVIADLRYNAYPDEATADLARAGMAIYGQMHFSLVDPSVVAAASRQWLDGDGLATLYRGTVAASHITEGKEHLDTLGIDVYRINFDDNTPATGTLMMANLRHWWLLEAGNSRKRVELMLNVGLYDANADVESYTTLRPALSVFYRLGDREPLAGTYDLAASVGLELRAYDAPSTGGDGEDQTIIQASASADRWWSSWLATGLFGGYAQRDSSLAGRDYQRVQAGIRLIATW